MGTEKRLTKREIFSMFIRSNFLLGSFNFERVQALGYCYVMIPAIKKLYGPGAKRSEALQRHLEWFNTHPWLTAPIFGVTAAMEEEMANNKKIDAKAINGMKIGLMGPLAGVGDPIFWGTLRPVLAALGASLALSGNIAGPLLFFFLINAVRLSTKQRARSIRIKRVCQAEFHDGSSSEKSMGSVALSIKFDRLDDRKRCMGRYD